MDAGVSLPDLMRIARNLQAVKMYSIAVCVVVWYDIALTFAEEVEKIWQQHFNLVTVLWAVNRYAPPLGFIVLTVSFHMPWPRDICQRYVLYPEALKLVTLTTVNIIFILRLYAIYFRHRAVLYIFVPLVLACMGVKIWAFTDGTQLLLPPGLVGCILLGAHPSSQRFVHTFVADLVFDTAVFVATLLRTITLYRRDRAGTSGSLLTVMMRDGIIYFAIIFLANLTTVMMYIFASADLKALNMTFSVLVTNVAASKLMLNLKRVSKRDVITNGNSNESNLIGNLGNPVGSSDGVNGQWNGLGDPESPSPDATPNEEIKFEVIAEADSVSSKEEASRTQGADSYDDEICEVQGRWEPRLVASPVMEYDPPGGRGLPMRSASFSRPSSPNDGSLSPRGSPVHFVAMQGAWQPPSEWT